MRVETLRLGNLVRPGETHHILRVHSHVNRLVGWHRHDFTELFWLCEGACRHETERGVEVLQVGDLRWLSPAQVHRLASIDRAGFAFFNLAFQAEILADLARRHGGLAGAPFPRSGRPGGVHLSAERRQILESRLLELFGEPRDLLHLEGFLLDLLLCTRSAPARAAPEHAPDWLSAALLRMGEPEYFCRGTEGLFQLCGRSREHVCRVFRRHLGLTPSAWVNQRRLAHARRQLLLSGRSVTEIALECGFGNLGHFHACFKAAYGAPPAAYRRSQRLG